jgi:small subunit ribosomal protein S18
VSQSNFGGGGGRFGGGGRGGAKPGGGPGGRGGDKKEQGKRYFFRRRKVCRFCADKNVAIDYKDPQTLKYFITDRGKIIPRRISGNCAKHQRKVGVAIKRARMIALMPFTVTGK